MANYPPAALARLVELSEQRRTRDLEHSHALTAATRNGKRAVPEAQSAFIEAKEAYSSEGYRVLNRSRLTVHNQEQIRALLELLDDVEPPYLLYRVTVVRKNSITDHRVQNIFGMNSINAENVPEDH